MKNILDRCKRVSIGIATSPKGGICNVHVDKWWIVTPEQEILFYLEHSPQCNADRTIAESIRDKNYPNCSVKQLSCVFQKVDPRDY